MIIIVGVFVGYGSRSSFHLKKAQAKIVQLKESQALLKTEVYKELICNMLKHMKSLFHHRIGCHRVISDGEHRA